MYGDADRKSDFEYFLSIYDELFEKYGHKFVAIRNKKVLNVYDDISEAVKETSKVYELGTFIVQECNGDESGYTNYISSWQLV